MAAVPRASARPKSCSRSASPTSLSATGTARCSPYRPQSMHWAKWELAKKTNPDRIRGDLATVIRGADLFIGFSVGDVVTPDMIRSMATDPIIFAFAGPVPEIEPAARVRRGCRDGRHGAVAVSQPDGHRIGLPGTLSRTARRARAAGERPDAPRRGRGARRRGVRGRALPRLHHSAGARFPGRPGDCRAVAAAAIATGAAKTAAADPERIAERTRQFIAEGRLPVAAGDGRRRPRRTPSNRSTCTVAIRACSRSRARCRSPTTTSSGCSTSRPAPSNRRRASPSIPSGCTTTPSSATWSPSSPTGRPCWGSATSARAPRCR